MAAPNHLTVLHGGGEPTTDRIDRGFRVGPERHPMECVDCGAIGSRITYAGGVVCDECQLGRDAMGRVAQAAIRGHTPEEISAFVAFGWPPELIDAAAEPGEREEMRALVSVMLELAGRSALAAPETT